MTTQTTAAPRPDAHSPAPAVTVVGLGPMGTALARALLRAGVPTTVWNRTAGRAQELAGDGAGVADSLAAAVAASDLVVACLRDHDAFRESVGALPDTVLEGTTVVHLSSASPADARRTAEVAARRGIPYLNGAIMSTTPMIGTPDGLVLYSGPKEVFDAQRPLLEHFGGADLVGADPGLASLLDVALLEVFFAGMTSFLHAAAMTTAAGLPARELLPHAQRIVAILPETLAGLARDVDAGTHPGDEDTLAMEARALEHMVAASEESGVDVGPVVVMRDLARRAVAAGHGADGFSRVVDVLRRPPAGGGH